MTNAVLTFNEQLLLPPALLSMYTAQLVFSHLFLFEFVSKLTQSPIREHKCPKPIGEHLATTELQVIKKSHT